MFAIVARTASIGRLLCRMPAVGHRAARVTHTLLFLAAQIALLSPGVCDACVKGCCESGTTSNADVASLILASHLVSNLPPAAASSGHGSEHCCGLPVADPVAHPVTQQAVVDRGAADTTIADVTADCRCQLEPREVPRTSASTGRLDRREIGAGWSGGADAGAVAWLPPLNGRQDDLEARGFAQESAAAIPSRPVRVLYGVWRN